MLFATPIDIVANTTYVASYYAPNGYYSAQPEYFNEEYNDSPPLRAPSSVASGGNGVYKYGAAGFPTSNFNANNYWVAVIFEPAP